MNRLNSTQIKFGIAGAHALFAVMMLFSWYGGVNGMGGHVAGWLYFIAALVVAAIVLADVLRFELPSFLGETLALVLSVAIAFRMLSILFAGTSGTDFALWIALIASLAGTAGILMYRPGNAN